MEVTGKHILIGVYASDIVVAAFPHTLMFAAWSKVEGLGAGSHPFSMDISYTGTDQKIGISGEIEVSDGSRPSVFVIPGLTATLEGSGTLSAIFDFKALGKIHTGEIQVVTQAELIDR